MSLAASLKRLARKLLRRDALPRLQRRGLVVGRDFYMQDDCSIDAWHCGHITIGDEVTLGPRVMILAHDASMRRALGLVRIARVRIGHRVFIGAGSIVLPGVSIGDDVIVAAGSVVTHDIASGSVAAGNPARAMGLTADYLARKRAEADTVPGFDARWTLAGGATLDDIAAMNARMTQNVGYLNASALTPAPRP